MSDFYLKTPDGLKMYRLEYHAVSEGRYALRKCYITGSAVTIANGEQRTGVDLPIETEHVLVEHIVSPLSVGTLAEYRALAKSVIDGIWT